eukprot:40130-Rhodomonas_salina.2
MSGSEGLSWRRVKEEGRAFREVGQRLRREMGMLSTVERMGRRAGPMRGEVELRGGGKVAETQADATDTGPLGAGTVHGFKLLMRAGC